MSGILSIGAYVPLMRLQRAAVYEANKWFALGLRGPARGERAIANWDEAVVTMAVEAARDCLGGPDEADVSTHLQAHAGKSVVEGKRVLVLAHRGVCRTKQTNTTQHKSN